MSPDSNLSKNDEKDREKLIEVPKCEKLRPQGQFFQSCTKKILSGTDRPKHSLDPIDYKLIDKNSFIL